MYNDACPLAGQPPGVGLGLFPRQSPLKDSYTFGDNVLIVQLRYAIHQCSLEWHIRSVNEDSDIGVAFDVSDLAAGILCGYQELTILIFEKDGGNMNGAVLINGPEPRKECSLEECGKFLVGHG